MKSASVEFYFPTTTHLRPPLYVEPKLLPSTFLRATAELLTAELCDKTVSRDIRSGTCNMLNLTLHSCKFAVFPYEARRTVFLRASAMMDALYKKDTPTGFWFGSQMYRAEQEHRIFALLFAADLAESGGE